MKNETKTLTLWKKLALLALTVSALGLTPALAAQADAAGAKKKADAAETEAAPATSNADADAPTGVVNLNTASEDELMLLPGVGPSKAAAIIAWRKKYGGFKKVDDLTKVKGFGHKTMKKLKPHLAVTGPTTYKGKKNPVEAAEQP